MIYSQMTGNPHCNPTSSPRQYFSSRIQFMSVRQLCLSAMVYVRQVYLRRTHHYLPLIARCYHPAADAVCLLGRSAPCHDLDLCDLTSFCCNHARHVIDTTAACMTQMQPNGTYPNSLFSMHSPLSSLSCCSLLFRSMLAAVGKFLRNSQQFHANSFTTSTTYDCSEHITISVHLRQCISSLYNYFLVHHFGFLCGY